MAKNIHPKDPNFRRHALEYLQKLTEKQFAEFFYDAVNGRNTSDSKDWHGHFVLANSEKLPDEPWETDFIALPENSDVWVDDSPICQSGECAECGSAVRSWAKQMKCPICGNSAYGT